MSRKPPTFGNALSHRRNIVRVVLSSLMVLGGTVAASAAVKLPAVIGENMVLQRGQPAPIWGWADPGEQVSVTVAGQTVPTRAGKDGKWKVTLPKLDVGGPLQMTVKGSAGAAIVLRNVLVGEVWVCSGQSNMTMPVIQVKNGRSEIAAASYPKIRLFKVPTRKSAEPQADCVAEWKECNPAAVSGFSAAAYFFGRQLHKELDVPVGLIDCDWGGSWAEWWASRKTLESNPVLKLLAGQTDSSSLYNGMLVPLIPYAIRGVIWYQGEANIQRAYQYRTLFPAIIANWRADWGQGDFPFGFVQIAPFSYSGAWGHDPSCCPELWEAQLMTLKSVPNTGMAVTVDLADPDLIHPKGQDYRGIHPTKKQEVGRRLALWALAKVYGRDLVYSGPIYASMKVQGRGIRLRFEHVGGGLIASDGKPLVEFTIAGEDRKFVPAVAAIDGNSVVVRSESVAQPVAVRHAWRDDALPNLANKEGLPASPFRTDSWKGVTEPK
jgi:sialate O-acetylesterase